MDGKDARKKQPDPLMMAIRELIRKQLQESEMPGDDRPIHSSSQPARPAIRPLVDR